MDEELQQDSLPTPPPPARDPREVVETYMVNPPREVVAYYFSPYQLSTPAPKTCAPAAQTPVKKSHRKALWIALGCLAFLLVATAGALLWQYYDDTPGWKGGSPDSDYAYDYESGSGTVSIPTSPLTQEVRLQLHSASGSALTPQAVYQLVNPATVTVMAQLDDGVSIGTGILFTKDGYLLTNFHVVEDGTSCSVGLTTGEVYDAKYVAGDKSNDIAILKVSGKEFPTAEIGNSDELAVGDPVYAIGNPLGLELRNTFTDGIVSAINRNVWVDGRDMTLVQTNAALNTGNSGGPLINQYGQVVGINTIKMISEDTNVEGLGFALPTSSIAYLVNDLMATGEVQPETSLGVTVGSLSKQLPDGTFGLEVFDVASGTGADKAGILEGDFIVSANGEAVTSSATLLRIRRDFHVGDTIPIRIWRDGTYLDVDVELQAAK